MLHLTRSWEMRLLTRKAIQSFDSQPQVGVGGCGRRGFPRKLYKACAPWGLVGMEVGLRNWRASGPHTTQLPRAKNRQCSLLRRFALYCRSQRPAWGFGCHGLLGQSRKVLYFMLAILIEVNRRFHCSYFVLKQPPHPSPLYI